MSAYDSDPLDLEPQPKTAARRWAEAYYKATSRSIRIYTDKAQRETFADLDVIDIGGSKAWYIGRAALA